MKNRIIFVFIILLAGLFLKFGLSPLLFNNENNLLRVFLSILILFVGASFVLRHSANIIEEATDILSKRTKIAGGVLQSFGTAFPDMVLGIVAAVTSLSLRNTDYALSVNYAIIAAATTFGSNIYNIGYAIWCVYRQNLANVLNKKVPMFPYFKNGGNLTPLSKHKRKPSSSEIETANDTLVALTILTAIVSVAMVMFGKVSTVGTAITGDLYQLIRPVGFLVLFLSIVIIFIFRKSKYEELSSDEVANEEIYFETKSNFVIWFVLAVSGLAILFAAESMVHSIQILSDITKIPVVLTGVLAGIIGCLGEMIVVHNYSVHPKGRIGDAIVGVAMDNIVTILGASIVSIIGGVFLGGNALILIFVLILTLNTILIWQINKLKNYL